MSEELSSPCRVIYRERVICADAQALFYAPTTMLDAQMKDYSGRLNVPGGTWETWSDLLWNDRRPTLVFAAAGYECDAILTECVVSVDGVEAKFRMSNYREIPTSELAVGASQP